MDDTGFLPLRSAELTSNVARRFLQLRALMDDLQKRLFTLGVATKDPTKSKSVEWWPILLASRRAYLRFWPSGWADHRETPLWLAFPRTDGNLLSAQQADRLRSLQGETPARLIVTQEYWLVPLYPLMGAERDDVLDDLVRQVETVRTLIQGVGVGAVSFVGTASAVGAVGAVGESGAQPAAAPLASLDALGATAAEEPFTATFSAPVLAAETESRPND